MEGRHRKQMSTNKLFSKFRFFFPHDILFSFIKQADTDRHKTTSLAYFSYAVVCCRTSSDMPDVLSRRKLKQSPSDQDLP